MNLNRKLRMGMVGGGHGAFIGSVHRMAAALDGGIELVAGAFSSDPEKSRISGADLYLDPSRVYGTYQEMAEKEAALSEDERTHLRDQKEAACDDHQTVRPRGAPGPHDPLAYAPRDAAGPHGTDHQASLGVRPGGPEFAC